MTERQAHRYARQAAKYYGQLRWVVRDDEFGWQVATEFDMETFWQSYTPTAAYDEEGNRCPD